MAIPEFFRVRGVFPQLIPHHTNGANPLIDANALIQRCQQSDKAAIRQATALMNAQLTTAFDQAFENT